MKTVFHYPIEKAGHMVAVAHATSLAHATKLAESGGLAGCKVHFNDPARGYCTSNGTPRLERF